MRASVFIIELCGANVRNFYKNKGISSYFITNVFIKVSLQTDGQLYTITHISDLKYFFPIAEFKYFFRYFN